MGGMGFGVAVGLSPRENKECYIMSISNICIAISIFVSLGGVLLIGVLLIGVRYAKKNESVSDFYLGGRKLGPIVTAMGAAASDMWNDLLMGLPGLADVSWAIIGLAPGTYFNWLLTARYLRRYTYMTGSYTLPQFFSRRFRAAAWCFLELSHRTAGRRAWDL